MIQAARNPARERRPVMKIMATFDGSTFAEAILPHLAWMATLPQAEFVLFSAGAEPSGRRQEGVTGPSGAVPPGISGGDAFLVEPHETRYAETKGQAIERRDDEIHVYLGGLIQRLPAGPRYTVRVALSHDAAKAIVECAEAEHPDVIVMATHGHSGIVRAMFGSVAEHVVRASVAPVLLVHPESVKDARKRDAATSRS
jgi:nucleotide-binding universal stress UspA family protein